jgi:hypothetical protein
VEIIRGVGVSVIAWATEFVVQQDLAHESDGDVRGHGERCAVHLEHVGFAVILIMEEARDSIRVQVSQAISVDDRETELLEIHQHVENFAIGEAALTFDQVEERLVVHNHREWFAIAEVHRPMHDGVVEAKCLALGGPPLRTVVVGVVL